MTLREEIAERAAEIKHRKSALQGVWPSASEEDLEIADAALSVVKGWLESEEALELADKCPNAVTVPDYLASQLKGKTNEG